MLKKLLTLTLSASLILGLVSCNQERASSRRATADARTAGPLPDLGNVPDFVLKDQNDQPFGSRNLRGTPYLAAFMFTRCPSICPRLTAKMKEVDAIVHQARLPLHLLSISVDPEYDTPAALSDYAKKHQVNTDRWTFVTGEFSSIAKTAEQGFKVGLSGKIDESKPHLGITHASHLILVDADSKIRGYFRTSDEGVENQILAALRELADGYQ